MKNIKNWEQFNESREDEDWSDEAEEWRLDAAKEKAYMRRAMENNPDDIDCESCGFIGDFDDYNEVTEEDFEEQDLDRNFNYVKCPECGEIFDI